MTQIHPHEYWQHHLRDKSTQYPYIHIFTYFIFMHPYYVYGAYRHTQGSIIVSILVTSYSSTAQYRIIWQLFCSNIKSDGNCSVVKKKHTLFCMSFSFGILKFPSRASTALRTAYISDCIMAARHLPWTYDGYTMIVHSSCTVVIICDAQRYFILFIYCNTVSCLNTAARSYNQQLAFKSFFSFN